MTINQQNKILSFGNYINGKWTEGKNSEVIESKNPANFEEIVGVVQSSSTEDVDDAVNAAVTALKQWKNISSVERGDYLNKAADIMESRLLEIAETATKEMGKTLAETKGEVLRAATILRYYAQEGLNKVGEVIPSANSKNLLYTTRTPVGVVGVISPWNFPIAIPIWKIAPALIYGNTVFFKPATETATTAAKLVEVFDEAGLPAGVLNFVTGKGSIIGDYFLSHNGINAISFTGSNEIGKKVAIAAINRGSKYQLEMGGKNPAIVLDDANLELATELVVNGAMKHTGQKCTATSKVFVHQEIYEDFKTRVLNKVKSIKIGNGLEQDVYMGPLATKEQQEKVLSYINKGKEEGATLLYGGSIPEGPEYKAGFYVEPTVFENVTNHMTIAREEIFGPVLCLIKVADYQEAIRQANDTEFGLSAAIFTRDLSKSLEFVNDIEVGMVKVNGETAGVEPQAPFGGMKQSSSHSREQGKAAIEFFTSIKTVTITPTP
ncbi:aldehyde dehydrogenase family protein [Schinkia azotoformans]|uniref:Aldehyde dehydrogenase n=1 Tax=Schinkia azotoformans LMG 9581 TaxID=1131731 RepID=K6CT76_SCHAZ|nr:alpha-ketoglutaric semialdehyde dehydrogenase GucD [Schinkia azotoformans]EKN63457.1 aldehyde dehydrogenase [Schinkia azotoformans LMG 9581]MEC1638756.1 aldehyde dehydrogenase family protein [Schinkia azotoformans]MEC1946721.1 aldehyde dehydrogenase family protein [Schinkia azotoformans]